VSKEPKAVLYFFIAFFLQLCFHAIEAVEELEEPDEATNDFDFEEALLFSFVIGEVIVGLGDLRDDENHFLYL